jgi:hypothetical protein
MAGLVPAIPANGRTASPSALPDLIRQSIFHAAMDHRVSPLRAGRVMTKERRCAPVR